MTKISFGQNLLVNNILNKKIVLKFLLKAALDKNHFGSKGISVKFFFISFRPKLFLVKKYFGCEYFLEDFFLLHGIPCKVHKIKRGVLIFRVVYTKICVKVWLVPTKKVLKI